MEIKGFDRLHRVLGEAPRRFRVETDRAVSRTAHIVRSRTVKGIGGEYQADFAPLSVRYALWKKRHRGSDLILVSGIRKGRRQQLGGNYRNSFAVDKIEDGVYAVGSNHPQARALELGYPKKNLPARPHLGRALDESRGDFKDEVLSAMQRTFQGI
jgi:phage gpG-like protein